MGSNEIRVEGARLWMQPGKSDASWLSDSVSPSDFAGVDDSHPTFVGNVSRVCLEKHDQSSSGKATLVVCSESLLQATPNESFEFLLTQNFLDPEEVALAAISRGSCWVCKVGRPREISGGYFLTDLEIIVDSDSFHWSLN